MFQCFSVRTEIKLISIPILIAQDGDEPEREDVPAELLKVAPPEVTEGLSLEDIRDFREGHSKKQKLPAKVYEGPALPPSEEVFSLSDARAAFEAEAEKGMAEDDEEGKGG